MKIILLKFSVLAGLCSLLFSCSDRNLESRLEKFYSENQECQNGYCDFSMQNITWFDWDTMKFRENDAGIYLDFYLKEKSFIHILKILGKIGVTRMELNLVLATKV